MDQNQFSYEYNGEIVSRATYYRKCAKKRQQIMAECHEVATFLDADKTTNEDGSSSIPNETDIASNNDADCSEVMWNYTNEHNRQEENENSFTSDSDIYTSDENYDHIGFSSNESEIEYYSDSFNSSEDPNEISEEHFNSLYEEDTNLKNLGTLLVNWKNEYNVSVGAATALLKILKQYDLSTLKSLPNDFRTLIKPKLNLKVAINSLYGGFYSYFGIRTALENSKIQLFDLYDPDICISVNIDGLPLFHSSRVQFWPILGSIKNYPVFIIAIYCGKGKPDNLNGFLNDFVNEVTVLIDQGFRYNNFLYKVNIHKIICDSPAKSFLLAVKGHAGYRSCTKCTIHGKYVENRVCFPEENDVEIRTAENFFLQTDELFHNGYTTLCEIPSFDVILDVPNDVMHSVYLGITKTFLKLWCEGSKENRLGYTGKEIINEILESIRASYVPQEFQRKPRGLQDLHYWKAVEFREFLLYVAPLALKKVLTPEKYVNFLRLHIAMRILNYDDNDEDILNYVQNTLEIFLQEAALLYGEHIITSNFHSILHLTTDYRRFGNVNNFTAFKFENFLGKLKKSIKQGNLPLQQARNRYLESISVNKQRRPSNNDGKKHIVFINNFALRTDKFKDSCCEIGKYIVIIDEFQHDEENNVFIKGRRFRKIDDLFKIPCSSTDVGIYVASHLSRVPQIFPIQNVTCKFYVMPYYQKDKYVLAKLLH